MLQKFSFLHHQWPLPDRLWRLLVWVCSRRAQWQRKHYRNQWVCRLNTAAVYIPACVALRRFFSQDSLLSWRFRLSLWQRETMWPWGAGRRRLPLPPQAPPQTSTRMASCCGAAPLPTWHCTESLKPVGDSTSATSQIKENHQRAGWLLEVRLASLDCQNST